MDQNSNFEPLIDLAAVARSRCVAVSNPERIKKTFPFEPLVGVTDAAKYLGLSEVYVRKMARRGQLPVINFSSGRGRGTWRFYISALADWCNQQLSSGYASTPQNGVTP